MANLQGYSSTSPDRFRHSFSLSSAPSPANLGQDWGTEQIDQVMAEPDHLEALRQEVDYDTANIESNEATAATSYPENESAHQGAAYGSVRHSNVVEFEFRSIHVGNSWEINTPPLASAHHSIVDILSGSAIRMYPGEFVKLAALWQCESGIGSELLSDTASATIFFQTYCDPSTWLIKRVLTCVTWENSQSQAVVANSKVFWYTDIKKAILDIQQMSGRDSVWYALRRLSLTLTIEQETGEPLWKTFQEMEMPRIGTEFLVNLDPFTVLGRYNVYTNTVGRSLCKIDPGVERRLRSTIPDVGRDMRDGNSMLAVAPPSRPASCPRFCLFVLREEDLNNMDTVYELLEEARILKNYYAEANCKFDPSDWKALRDWSKALKGQD